jgi:Protein of unknown function (DUF1573)
MKKLFILSLSIVLFTSCKKEKEDQNQIKETSISKSVPKTESNVPKTESDVPKGKVTLMTFDKKIHDFGVIKADSKVSYTFKFTNSGTNDLLITDAKGSCGCTIPEYSKEPIKPGATGEIKVVFDSKNKQGEHKKTVTVHANTPTGVEKLTIRASISEGNKDQDAPKTITSK